MNAADIARALGDARREGRTWRCRCPLHGGCSLTLRDGEGGCVLVTCWGGCNRLDVLAELRRRGLLDGRTTDYRRPSPQTSPRDDVARTARALAIWHEARPAVGTIVESYLRSRGILLDAWPAVLRFHPACPRPRDEVGNLRPPLPAMMAMVEHAQRGPVAVHATYLRPDGSGKADIPKKQQKASFGPIKGGAVRLSIPRAGEWLAVGEGTETTLSVAAACAMPGWAALSAGGIRSLVLSREATHVIICADHDASGVGERAARDAAARWLAEGRRVKLALPPRAGIDFNDILRGVASAPTEEARRVAD
jgi:putative DNA primase/helicase